LSVKVDSDKNGNEGKHSLWSYTLIKEFIAPKFSSKVLQCNFFSCLFDSQDLAYSSFLWACFLRKKTDHNEQLDLVRLFNLISFS